MAWALVEGGLRLSVDPAVKFALASGQSTALHQWAWTRDGERCASIGFRAEALGADYGHLELLFSVDGHDVHQVIYVESSPCNFGGLRWYARCPRRDVRVAKLYLPYGAIRFLSRQAYRLSYQSQRDTAGLDRLINRRNRLLARTLKSDDPFAPARPKWMRWRTFERHLARLDDYHADIDGHLARHIERLGGLL